MLTSRLQKALQEKVGPEFVTHGLAAVGLRVGKHKCPLANHPGGPDENPSFQVYPDGGSKCFAGDHHFAPSIYGTIQALIGGADVGDAIRFLWHRLVEPLVDPSDLHNASKGLVRHPEIQDELLHVRLIPETVQKNLRLGWRDNRVWFPSFNAHGLCINVRKHDSLRRAGGPKTLPYRVGWRKGLPPTCFPHPVIGQEAIFVEGEPDCCVLRGLGFPAYTYGSSTDFLRVASLAAAQLEGVHVRLVPDADPAGQEVAEAWSQALRARKIAFEVLAVPHGHKDAAELAQARGVEAVTEWLNSGNLPEGAPLGAGSAPLSPALTAAPPVDPGEAAPPPETLPLEQAMDYGQNFGKTIQTTLRCVGAFSKDYALPETIRIKCRRDEGDPCLTCWMPKNNCNVVKPVPIESRAIAEIVGATDAIRVSVLKRLTGLPPCKSITVDTETGRNVTMAHVTAEDQLAEQDAQSKPALVPFHVRPGKIYEVVGQPINSPIQQQAVFHAFSGKEKPDWLNSTIFAPEDVLTLAAERAKIHPKALLQRHAMELMHTVTQIKGRMDLHALTILTLHSPLSFFFGREKVARGWLDVLVIGDTQMGKTKTVSLIFNWYDAGKVIGGESASRAGILGGVETKNGPSYVTWGVWPQLDGRACIMEEFPPAQVMADLTRARSEGITEVTKIGSYGAAQCRLRKVWTANPPKVQTSFNNNGGSALGTHRTMDTYAYGIQTVLDRVEDIADVSRFDAVCVTARGEVAAEVVNRAPATGIMQEPKGHAQYRLAWAWTRKEDQVVFTDEAYRAVLVHTLELSQRYSPDIPLFTAEDGRFKLARLSAALATFCMSTDDGETVKVNETHVDVAAGFLKGLYDKPVCAFQTYSNVLGQASKLPDEARLEHAFQERGAEVAHSLAVGMLASSTFTERALRSWANDDSDYAHRLANEMIRQNAVVDKRYGFERRPALLPLLKRLVSVNGHGS